MPLITAGAGFWARTGLDLLSSTGRRHAEDDRWPRKIRDHKSNADNDIIDITALLAEAEAIKDNPDAVLEPAGELLAA